jgi:hypothetical protein
MGRDKNTKFNQSKANINPIFARILEFLRDYDLIRDREKSCQDYRRFLGCYPQSREKKKVKPKQGKRLRFSKKTFVKSLTYPVQWDTLVNAPEERGSEKKRTESDEAPHLDRKIV